jgi:hypothetical protein
MLPQCGFGLLGLCCRNCVMGPSRIKSMAGDIGFVPYSEAIRTTDRNEISILDALSPELYKCFEDMLHDIEKVFMK